MQLSKFTSANLDIIVLYRSTQGNKQEMNQLIKQFKKRNVPQLVIGDFNSHYLEEGANSIKQFFSKENYSQLIMEPTHIEGNILDQAYVKDESKLLKFTAEIQTKYYTDHRGIAITVENGEKIQLKNILYIYHCFR